MTVTTSDIAYSSLRNMVAEGELKPGERLSLRRLAKHLGCSTLPVLEAMRRLESDGLLVKQPRRMARVRELSVNELEQLYLVREGLESITARMCAQRVEADEVQRLWQLSRQFDQGLASGDTDVMRRHDVAIHRLIAQAARCPLIEEELGRMLVIERTAGEAGARCWAQASAHSRHTALIQAIEDSDPDSAAYLMKKHIQSGYQDVLQQWKDQQ